MTPADILNELRRFELHKLDGGGVAGDFDGLERFFERVLSSLSHPDEVVRAVAFERLEKTFWTESMLVVRKLGERRMAVPERLERVLAAVNTPMMFELFVSRLASVVEEEEDRKQRVRDWLVDIHTKIPGLSEELVQQCRMKFRLEDIDWLAELDADDVDTRAVAAAQLGGAVIRGERNFDDIVSIITQKDLARPGVAGPFYTAIQFDREKIAPGFDFCGWMLEILAKRRGPEPEFSDSLGIDFHAHEQLSGNPTSIRRLLELGLLELAVETATEIRAPIPEMRELLMELGAHENPAVAQRIGWHLAYEYGIAHDSALERGFVRYQRLDRANLFVLYAPAQLKGPYSIALHVRPGEPPLSLEDVWRLIDPVCPPAVRGPIVENNFDHKVAPFSVGDNLMFQLERALVVLDNSKEGPWDKVTLSWRGRDGDWNV